MDKEYIERGELLKHQRKMHGFGISPEDSYWTFAVHAEDIKNAPAADVAEIVRCKDCRYFFNGECLHSNNRVTMRVPDFGEHYSYKADLMVSENHYCGYGEKCESKDMVSVVRCEECKHSTFAAWCSKYSCRKVRSGEYYFADHYCSFGERK